LAALANTALRLSIAAHLDELETMTKAVHSLPRDKGRIVLQPRGPVEVRQGEGLGELLTLGGGRRRIHEYALATGTSFESWAGAAAGPVEVARKLGVSRSTLQAWQTQRLAVGLLNGARKTAFPLEQSVEGKPVAGIADVWAVIGAEGDVDVAQGAQSAPERRDAARTPEVWLPCEVLRAAQTNFGL